MIFFLKISEIQKNAILTAHMAWLVGIGLICLLVSLSVARTKKKLLNGFSWNLEEVCTCNNDKLIVLWSRSWSAPGILLLLYINYKTDWNEVEVWGNPPPPPKKNFIWSRSRWRVGSIIPPPLCQTPEGSCFDGTRLVEIWIRVEALLDFEGGTTTLIYTTKNNRHLMYSW